MIGRISQICSGLTIAAFSTFAFAAPGASVLSEHDLREACSNFSQAGMRDCLAKKATDSQSALKRSEENAAKILSRWDEDDQYIRTAQGKLARSNSVFEQYRDAQCEFSASLSGGAAGNAHEIRRLACVASLNGQRADELSNASSELARK